jgi:hypothetical protein
MPSDADAGSYNLMIADKIIFSPNTKYAVLL